MTEESREGGGNPEIVDAPRHDAFATQRRNLRTKDRRIEELEGQLDEKESDGDPNTAAMKRRMREFESRLDSLSMSGLDEGQVEEVMAKHPWIEKISNKADRIQAVKDLIARDQRAETNAGDPPIKGRSKSEAATRAHLTGGGPPATNTSGRDDAEVEMAKFEKLMGEAKTQVERDKIVTGWSEKHPEDQQL